MVLWRDGARAVIQRSNPGRAAADPAKVHRVMDEWKAGALRSHGRRVTGYRQAVAIALAEGRRARRQTMARNPRARRNPRGGGMGVMELLLLGGAAWFVFRTPATGQPSLFAQFTSGLPGSVPIPGQLTLPATAAIPMGYRQVSVTPSGQRIVAPIPPGGAGYIPAVYQTATTASGLTGAFTSIVQQIGALFGASPAHAAPAPLPLVIGTPPPIVDPVTGTVVGDPLGTGATTGTGPDILLGGGVLAVPDPNAIPMVFDLSAPAVGDLAVYPMAYDPSVGGGVLAIQDPAYDPSTDPYYYSA
jgi:hypothetical protein